MTPTTFIIFGITGDLAGRKILPSLLNLYLQKRLSPKFAIVGFSRRAFTRGEFREYIRGHMKIKPGEYREEDIKHFLDHMYYEQGFFDASNSYASLSARLGLLDEGFGVCSNKLFHLAVAPHFYETILNHLSNSGLTVPCNENNGGAKEDGWTRVLVEKPFGNNAETAKKLDKRLGELFKENQIFRIDHYLAKESLQNILAFRFTNSLFEPLWNFKHVDAVHIKLLESAGVHGRGAFYDDLGALKDVGQNHILQMLALVTMEPPKTFDASTIRKERAKVLSHLVPITSKNMKKCALRAQYEGYVNEMGVKKNTQTETYFRLETRIQTPRWKGVPFFLESGKAMRENKSEIDVYFKNPSDPEKQNILIFRIQPDEGIKIRFNVKTPGFDMKVEPKTLKFKYADFSSLQVLPDAYERVLYDAITGDQTLFTSTDEVMAAWKFITPIMNSWGEIPLIIYKKGEDMLPHG